MSQTNPKYKRLEALLSGTKAVEPDPNRAPEGAEVERLKAQVNELEAKLVEREPAQNAPVPAPLRKTTAELRRARPSKEESTGAAETSSGAHKQLALWTAGIFASLGLIFLIFSLYNVIILQRGHLDGSDMVLTPVTILMSTAGLIGFRMIRRDRLMPGLWVIFGIVLIPPISSVLVLWNVYVIALVYIAILASAMITWVFPKPERRKATLAASVAALIMIIIEIWDPWFRIKSTTLEIFAPYAIGLAAITLLAYLIRQAVVGNIRTKLIVAFAFVTLVAGGITGSTAQRSYRIGLEENIGENINNIARAKAVEIGQTVEREFNLLNSLAISDAVRNAAVKANRENNLNQAAIEFLDQQWRAADAADDNAYPLVAFVLANELSPQLARFKDKFPQHVEVFLTDHQGVNIASTNRTSDYYQGDEEWWQAAYQKGVYIGQPEYDESSKTVAFNMAVAVYAEASPEVVGVLRSTVDFNILSESLITGRFGQTGRTDIYLPNNQELEMEVEEDGTYEIVMQQAALDFGLLKQSKEVYIELLHDDIPTLASQAVVGVSGSDRDARAISDLDWRVVVMQDQAEAFQPINTQARNSIIIGIGAMVVAIIAAIGLARVISGPVVRLNAVAQKVADGDLAAQAKVETHDEVGTLAATFNDMTSQLRSLVDSLEQRVTDRTHDLELASEVGRTVTRKVADLNEMLTTAAEMIRARFGLYYTQVYLTDPAGHLLFLRAGTGEVGEALLKQGHRLMIDSNSLNGRAVLEKKPVIVADTLKNPTFRPNPLLPKTRSEMAVPLISGDRILGVLDMQSEEPGTLSETNLPAFEALAGQLAIAIQNAGLFAETERARAEMESQARRLARTGWADYLNAIHKPERTGFVFDRDRILPLEGMDPPASMTGALSAPIEITGEPIGTFHVELEQEKWTEEKRELIQSVARQVAQQVENLRLLETAERYRAEAEEITRRLTHEGWQEYSGSLKKDTLGYAYNLEQVLPLEDNGHHNPDQAVMVPLSVRDEAIGELTVDRTMTTEEAREIVETVASQLSSHIENLRLSEQNEKRAAELEMAVNQLRELDRLKSSFLANMSHELRTPLNSILGFADVMLEELDGPLTENMQNDLGLIQKNGQHLLHLINDVLDMAKIEAGRMNFNPEKFRVHEILDEVTSITSTLASEKNLALFIESDSDREVEITADRTRLRQVMINLVNNSIKFTDKGKIAIHACRRNEHVLISVKDTGIGIPADKLEDVFQEFAQVDTSTTRKAGGTGLGLPISRKLIEMHGGRLWAESTGVENEGSTFHVELPLEARLTEPVEKLVK